MLEELKKYLPIMIALAVSIILLWAGNFVDPPDFHLEIKMSLIIAGFISLVVTFIVAVVHFYCPKICQKKPAAPEGPAPSTVDGIEARTLRNVVIGAGILVMGTFTWAGTYVYWKQNAEVALPIVIIAGVIVLLLVLGLVTFVFSVLKLSNKEEALGLPSGSVRAVIALMLLVVFAIVAIFLYSDISASGRLQTIEHVKAGVVMELKKQLDVVTVTSEGKDGDLWTVYYRSGSKAAEDLAKQLIVLLGTLVTAVSSFYFGSSSIAAATKQRDATGGPVAKTASPDNLKAGGEPQPLTITGTNLGTVANVKLTFEKEEPILADASTIVAGETSVVCKIKTPAEAKFGPWTVVVSDSGNNDSRVPDSVTIGTKPQPVATITSIDQTSITPGPNPQPLTITGTNLGKVDGVKLVMAGKPDIPADANGFEPSDKQVKCNFTVKAGTDPGEREVVAFEGANKVATARAKIKIG